MEKLFKFNGVLVTVLLTFVLRSYVIAKAWTWIAVPLFEVRSLTVVQAFALNSLLVIMMPYGGGFAKTGEEKAPDWSHVGKALLKGAVVQLGLLGIAWIAKGLL